MVDRTPLIAGNWKLQQDHLQAIAFVQKLSWTLQDADHDFDSVEVAVFPPFTDLRSVQTLVDAEKFRVRYGSQDVSEHDSGAYTGEVSGAFLAKLGSSYAIVGHSERRQYHAESDAIVGRKAAAAVRHGVVPVICVGETADDLEQHGAAAVPVQQLRDVLSELPTGEFVVAYEPVWAIGSGKAATPEQAEQVCAALREVIAEARDQETADATRILYGGSVKSGNIAGFMREPNIDGALVGGASLDAAEFAAIARFKSHVGV
ncbi:triose-phosphate isomerase [Agrococcus casei]|uniref:Triosephosphate isomerase n=1 Tax=Agrococcus casei LMG 22410 TaxID=1255656 RepID=A0A1R4FRJ6_9MICO|nr:triose-phosphate isomerase [Agrococcus casei]SJM58548.1 Triosephosphate isomerase [Agrococcus casei LMG 22410]